MRKILMNLVFFVVLIALFIFGEIPTGLVVGSLLKIVEVWLPETGIVVTYFVSALVITLVGRFLGALTIRSFNRSGDETAKSRGWLERQGIDTKTRVKRIFRYGQGFAFVVASLTGGAALIAWWFSRKGDPRVRAKTWLGAAILGTLSPAWWIAFYLPRYRVFGVLTMLVVILTGVAYPFVAQRRYVAQHAAVTPSGGVAPR